MKTPDKVVELYNGSVRVEYFDKFHKYLVNGEKALGVTNITSLIDKSRVLIYWAVNLARDYLIEVHNGNERINLGHIEIASKLHAQRKKEAADLGTLVHLFCEEWIKAKVAKRKDIAMPEDPRVLNGVIAFLKWVDEHKVKFLESERVIYSKKHKFIGTMDCVFTMGEEKHKIIHVGDFKTSKGVYDEMIFQVTAYEEAYVEETKAKCGDKYILRFDKETAEFEPHVIPAEDHKKDIAAFLGLMVAKKRLIELELLRKNTFLI
jgi:hypothetical protein